MVLDIAERVARSNEISSRERVRGHAHEQAGGRMHFGAVKARMTRQNDTRAQLRSLRDQREYELRNTGVAAVANRKRLCYLKLNLWKKSN